MSMNARILGTLQSDAFLERLQVLYGTRNGMAEKQRERWGRMLFDHADEFGGDRILIAGAPGRVEIGGNHTDHNHGRVLAGAVNLDCLCAVTPRNDMMVHLHSEGYRPLTVDLKDLTPHEDERGTTKGLIRGVAAGMAARGMKIGGFDANATSTVASGSGLSSSAAFEVMMTAVLNALYNDQPMEFIDRAVISQKAENAYFGKPCGLLDQMASAAGGLVNVDFGSEQPQVCRVQYDFSAHGYALVVTATGGSHAKLTDEYAAIPAEMKAVAHCFGREYLRDVSEDDFYRSMPSLRRQVSDRALLRACHFFEEDHRVDRETEALEEDRLDDFLTAVCESGRSSYMYLQNIYASSADESLAAALAMSEHLLKGRGAWRIHGGGFAGTILAFVPDDCLPEYLNTMREAFGEKACKVLDIRPEGAVTQWF